MNKKTLYFFALLLLLFSCKQKKIATQKVHLPQDNQLCLEADKYTEKNDYQLDTAIFYYENAANSCLSHKDTAFYLDCYASVLDLLIQHQKATNFFTYYAKISPFFSAKYSENAILHKHIATIYTQLCKQDSAILYYEKALVICQNLADSPDKNWTLGQILDEKAFFCAEINDYSQAIINSLSAISQYQKISDKDTRYFKQQAMCQSNLNLGRYYLMSGYEKEAFYYYHKAEKIPSELPNRYEKLTKYHLYAQAQKLDSAYFYVKKLIALRQKQANEIKLGRAYKYLGEILFQRKKYKQAIDTLQLALQLRKEDAVGMAATYKTLAEVYFAQNQQVKAEESAQKGLFFVTNGEFLGKEKGENPRAEEIAFPLEGLELCMQKVHILKEKSAKNALQIACVTDTFIDKVRANLSADGSKLVLADKVTHFYHEAMEIALTLGEKEKAFYFSEKAKAFLLFSAIKEVNYKQISGIPKDSLAREQSLLQNLTLWKKKENKERENGASANKERMGEIQQHILGISLQLESFKRNLEKLYPNYYRLKYSIQPDNIAQLQKNVLDNQAIIEYFCGQKNWAWVITNKSADCILLEKKGEDSVLMQFVAQISNAETSPEVFNKTSFLLYQSLVEPIMKMAKAESWVIIPDGALNYLPFEALMTDNQFDTLPYLLKKKCISYHYSASLWAYLRNVKLKSENKENYFVAAVEKFQDKRLLRFEKTKSLIETLKEKLGQGKELFPAKKEDFLQNFQGKEVEYPLVCLYTHSQADDYVAEKSVIYLEDDVLNLSEIFSLRMKAGLVILASCESGKGKLHKGEGMMSLARGFMYAGGESILPTKWKVGEAQTNEILQYFIAELQAGKPKDVALRNAKLAFIHKSQGKAKPYDWAAAFLIGNTDMLPFEKEARKEGIFWQTFVALQVLLVVLGLLWYFFYKQ